VLNEASAENNLIDLGPASPAVVTPRVSTTPTRTPTSTLQPPAPAAATPAATAAPASLSTQLAGLGEGLTCSS
ncbi:hypothetical protein M9458_007033, partial [Cirrhinus mrigala]